MMIISIVAIVLAVLAIVYTGHLAIVYHTFNEGIKDWATALDDSAKDSIYHAARQILRELDRKAKESEQEENVEPLNNNEDE